MGSETDHKKENGKQFVYRNSILTDLFENNHIRTVYHLFLTIFINLFVNTVAYDYLKNGHVVLGLDCLRRGFARFHITVLAWLGHFAATCLVYYIFKIWARIRRNSPKQAKDLGLPALMIYYGLNFATATYVVRSFDLPTGSAGFLTVEQTRLLMKVHSFVRSNSTKNYVPTFYQFLYFLFVPTIVYRDNYPKTSKINWSFAIWRFMEVVGSIVSVGFVFDRLLNPTVQEFGLRKFKIHELCLAILENTTAAMLLLLLIFFLTLHSWQNMFAELTYFGDRMFYRDWWNCTNWADYFRKWNTVVQDWLFEYIYKEFHSKFAVLLISAIIHEWILITTFNFFFPLLFIEFLVLGSIFLSIGAPNTNLFNIIFWICLSLGASTLVTMYAIEYYARTNAPVLKPTLYLTLMPRFLTCDCIDFS